MSVARSWTGLFAGALAWGTSTQLNYVLAPWQCEHGWQIVPFTAAALVVVALAGGFVSWRSLPHGDASREAFEPTAVPRFTAMIAMMAAGLFALAIALQGSAALILNGCIR